MSDETAGSADLSYHRNVKGGSRGPPWGDVFSRRYDDAGRIPQSLSLKRIKGAFHPRRDTSPGDEPRSVVVPIPRRSADGRDLRGCGRSAARPAARCTRPAAHADPIPWDPG